MAVVIQQALTYTALDISEESKTSAILAARTPNVARWYSDSVGSASSCDILITYGLDAWSFTIYPDPDGFFEYDFREIFNTIVNIDNDDNIYYDEQIVESEKLFRTVEIGLTVNIAASEETEDLGPVYLMNAALNLDRIERYKNMWLYESNTSSFVVPVFPIPIPAPRKHSETTSHILKIWKGYPFEFSVIGFDTYDNMKITSSVSGDEVFTGTTQYPDRRVRRLIISDGQTDKMTLSEGKEVWTVGHEAATIFNKDIEVEIFDKCGVYLKWINELGTYSYWLFDYFQFKRDSKTKNTFNVTTSNWSQSQGQSDILNYDSFDTLVLKQKGLTGDEAELIASIGSSPKVYLYKNEKGESAYNRYASWERINNVETSIIYDDLKKKRFKAEVKIKVRDRF